MNGLESKTSPLVVACAWIVVAVPLAWGVYQSLVKSSPLFFEAAAPASSSAAGK